MRILSPGIFLGMIWDQILAPFQFKKAKLSKMVYIIPNYLVLHFGENFMKIRRKIAKLQMHGNLHSFSIQIFMSFYEVQLNQHMLYPANILSAV